MIHYVSVRFLRIYMSTIWKIDSFLKETWNYSNGIGNVSVELPPPFPGSAVQIWNVWSINNAQPRVARSATVLAWPTYIITPCTKSKRTRTGNKIKAGSVSIRLFISRRLQAWARTLPSIQLIPRWKHICSRSRIISCCACDSVDALKNRFGSPWDFHRHHLLRNVCENVQARSRGDNEKCGLD